MRYMTCLLFTFVLALGVHSADRAETPVPNNQLLPQAADQHAPIDSMQNQGEHLDKLGRDWLRSRDYTSKKDYKAALALLDSMALYARHIGDRASLPEIFRTKSELYVNTGNHKRALANFKEGMRLADSLQTAEQEAQLNELKVQYEVDKLSYDNAQLQNERRQMLILVLAFGLLSVLALCVYLYYNLRREQRMQQGLDLLRAKAKQSEQQKTAFINHICHEIRTPLNAISGFSHLVTDPETDDESQQEFFELISENSGLLTTLIDHLLTVSSLYASGEKLPGTRTDIAAICREEFQKAKMLIRDSIVCKCEIPDGRMAICANEEYLGIMVGNLLSNAGKFTQKGEITLSLSTEESSGNIRITVTDTGCGIPEADQKRVFDRFVKLNRFTIGNGLGLYICRLIATRMEGTIAVDPEYTQGTRIVVELPSEGGVFL